MNNSKKKGQRKRKSAKGSSARPLVSRPDWVPEEPWEPKVALPAPRVAAKMAHPTKVQQAISTHLRLEELGLEVRLMVDGTAFGIYDGDHRVGSVSDSRAIIRKHSRLDDFTTGSAPWADVQSYLAEQIEKTARAARTELRGLELTDARRVDAWPISASAAAVSLGADASRRLRTERVHDHDRAVTLRAADATLLIEPIASGGLLPFRYTPAQAQSVRGALVLRSAGETISMLVEGEVEDRTLTTAWLAALCGFADLTCQPRLDEARTRRMWSASRLVPRSASAEHMAGAVSGHVRRLPHGQVPGEEATERAASIGVQLRNGETWVRPHARGAKASDGEVLFDWKPSATVTAQLSVPADRDDAKQRAA